MAESSRSAIARSLIAWLDWCASHVTPLSCQGWSALMFAAANGHHDVAAVLIDGGAKIDATNAKGQSARDLGDKAMAELIDGGFVQGRGYGGRWTRSPLQIPLFLEAQPPPNSACWLLCLCDSRVARPHTVRQDRPGLPQSVRRAVRHRPRHRALHLRWRGCQRRARIQMTPVLDSASS